MSNIVRKRWRKALLFLRASNAFGVTVGKYYSIIYPDTLLYISLSFLVILGGFPILILQFWENFGELFFLKYINFGKNS